MFSRAAAERAATRLRCALVLALLAALAGCATPPTDVQQPMTARPAPRPVALRPDGAIFQAGPQPASDYQSLFADRRAHAVGDVLTIDIAEKTSASKSADTSADRTASNNASVSALAGLPGKSFLGSLLKAGSSSTFEGKGASSSNNDFTGIITVTVTRVLSNGNLEVSGEKEIGINQGSEYIRFSGVVNPATIAPDNTVQSTQVADAHIEYRGKGYIDEAQTMGWLARLFLSVLPF